HVINFEWGTIASKYDDISKAIKWTHNQLLHRIGNKIKDAHKIILLVDEAEAVVANNKESLVCLIDIAHQARKYGIHLIITSKKPTQDNLPNLANELSNRWVGKTSMDQGTVSRLMGQSINIKALTGEGDFIHVDNDGLERFIVAQLRNSDFEKLERLERPAIDSNGVNSLKKESIMLPKKGRPVGAIDMYALGYYFRLGPNILTAKDAKNLFGFSRYVHNQYREYIKLMAKGYLAGGAKKGV
ncbi:MAG: hypothetical protein ACR2P5_03590, partial [Gammaproteobacteria bacterium]